MANGWLGRFWANGWLFREHRGAAGPDWSLRQNTASPDGAGTADPSSASWYFGQTLIVPPAGALAIVGPPVGVTDAGGATMFAESGSPTSVWNYSHLVPAGANCLVVAVSNRNAGPITTTGVTYNGVSLTQAGGSDATSGTMAVGIWFLVNPPTGALQNLQITTSGSGLSVFAIGMNLAGVNTAAPVNAIATAAVSTGGGTLATLTPNAAGPQDLYIAIAQDSAGALIFGVGFNASAASGSLPPNQGGQNPFTTDIGEMTVSQYNALGVMEWITQPASTALLAAVAFQFYVNVTSDTAALAFNGLAPTVTINTGGGINITPTAGAIAFTGAAPALLTPRTIAPPAGALALAGSAPSILTPRTIAPLAGALAFTGAAPALLNAQNITPLVGAIALTGQTPALLLSKIITPSTGALALTGQAPALALKIAPTAGALAFTGQLPTVSTQSGTTPAAGALAFTGAAPGIGRSITPPAGALAFTGVAPVGGVSYFITPNVGGLAFVGEMALEDNELGPSAGALAFTGAAPTATIQSGIKITPDAGALGFVGIAGQAVPEHQPSPPPPVPSIPTWPFQQYLQSIAGAPQVMTQNAPYLLPEEVD